MESILFDVTPSAGITLNVNRGIYNTITREVFLTIMAIGTIANDKTPIATVPKKYIPVDGGSVLMVAYNSSGECSPYSGVVKTDGTIVQHFGSNITRLLIFGVYKI